MAETPENNQKDVLEKAVQQFIDVQLAGQEPDLGEFVKDYPGLEDQIRQRICSLGEIDSLFASLMNGQDDNFGETIAGYELIGQTLGDFEILSLIGTGGMGAVFLARQISLDREVALKVISDVGGIRGKSLERFKREAEVLAKTSHPNIVPIYEVGEQGPYSYFAMEYIEGVSLDRILASIRNVSPDEKASDVMRKCPEAQADIYSGKSDDTEGSNGAEIDKDYIVTVSRMIISIASALEYAHNKGILHRDVKPSNILIASDGTAKLVDFGLAKAETQPSITVTGEFFGTASYVSPEQIRKPETADRRSDVYSLAATYYECLTLRPPFEGDTINETLTRVISREAVPPKKYCSRLSTDFNTVLLKALEKLPSERYPTASEFAAEIQCILDFKPITAKRPSVHRRAYKALRRKPIRIALITVAVLVGVLGYWVISYQLESRTRRAAKELFDTARKRMTTKSYTEALELLGQSLSKKPDYVDAYLASAECQRFLGNYEVAVELGRKAISIDDDNSGAYYQLGQTFIALRDCEQGKAAFQQAIDIDPDFALAHAGMAACYQFLRMDIEALEEYRQAIAIERNMPGNNLIYLNIANILASMGKYQEGIEAYQEVLATDPMNATAYVGIGNCYGLLNDQTKSQEAFKKAASIEPENLQIYDQLAQMYLKNKRPSLAVNTYRSAGEDFQRLGKFEQALQSYISALEIDPNNVLVLIGVGECYKAVKNYREATLSFKKAASCASEDSDRAAFAYVKLGGCLGEMGQNADAVRAYSQAISINPDFYPAYSMLGAHYIQRGLHEDAIKIYKKAMSVDPTKLQVYSSLGDCYMSLAKYSEAVEHYQKYLPTDPNSYLVLMSMAMCYQQLDNHIKAVELLENAAEIQPHEAIYSSLGYSYFAIGDYLEASGAYNRALALNPNNVGGWGCLAECYEKLGVFDKAIKSYEKYLALQPDSALAFTKLAIIYGTCKDAKFRDADKAVKLATKACELTNYEHYLCLSCLAAAYAELGDFEKAVEWQKKVIELAGDNIKIEYAKRLATYKAKKPWRQ